MDIKGISGEISDRNEEYDTENWRKGNPCYTVVENLAELCSVGWKVELGYLAEETAKQSVKVPARFLLAAYNKMWEDRHKLKNKLLNIKEAESEDLENSQPICSSKNEKASSGENTKGMAGQCPLKRLWVYDLWI